MHVNPSLRNMELYHLRLMLLNVKGCTAWADLLTVDGIQCATFRQACDALGIGSVDVDFDYRQSLLEVCKYGSPWQIRQFYATLLAHCFLRDAISLWFECRNDMSNDFVCRGHDRITSLRMARDAIAKTVIEMAEDGTTLQTVLDTMPLPDETMEEGGNALQETECLHDIAQTMSTSVRTLTAEQQSVFDMVMAVVLDEDKSTKKVFRLTAPAGCGKTYFYNALIEEIERVGRKCVSTAFTGIAAALLPGGETCHRAFGIPVRSWMSGNERSFIERGTPDAEALENASLILIDEASMLSKVQAIIIDQLLRMITGKTDVLCGGKVVLFGGDMGQVLPVLDGIPPSAVDNYSLPAWEHWKSCTTLTLSTNMRAITDPDFAKWLTTVRDGTGNIGDSDVIILPDNLVIEAPKSSNANDDKMLMLKLADKVFGDCTEHNMLNGVILSPTNDVVREVNEIITKKLPGSARCYLSKTSLDVEDCAHGRQGFEIAQEELDNIRPARIPPHRLELKIGSIIMLLLNMNKRQGLCNGTRFIVTGMYKDVIRVRRIAPFRGVRDEIYIPKLYMRTDDVPVAGSIKRFQIPVTLASCMTINKAQGQSFSKVGLFLRRPVFGHGQFFVGVSRAEHQNGLSIAVVDGPQQGKIYHKSSDKGTRTRNIVKRHLLH